MGTNIAEHIDAVNIIHDASLKCCRSEASFAKLAKNPETPFSSHKKKIPK